MHEYSNLGYVDSNNLYELQENKSLSGGFCNIVFLKLNAEQFPQTSVAIKYLKSDVAIHWLVREMYILKRLKHHGVIQYIGHTYHGSLGYGIILEYMECGTLYDRVVDPHFRYDWSQVGSWSGQLLLALQYIHSKEIVHSDLNLKNLLLKNNCKVIKVADFGSARRVNETRLTENMFVYCNPSVFTGEHLTAKLDIFAYGMILWWIIYRRDPFPGLDSIQCNYLLLAGVRPRTGENFNLHQIFHSCWSEDPQKRKSATELLRIFHSH